MQSGRLHKYQVLTAAVGATPLVRIWHPQKPQLQLYGKCEYLNPTGSHHDRQAVAILQALETAGTIVPGRTRLVDVTTGCAGASLAWAAGQLGYDVTLLIPAYIPAVRQDDCRRFGANVISIDGGIPACIKRLRTLLSADPELYCVNHTRHPAAVTSMYALATELTQCFRRGTVVGLIGSGGSLAGVAQTLVRTCPQSWRTVAWEPFASAIAYEQQQPGAYSKKFGILPGTLSHKIYGGSFAGVSFPHYAALLPALQEPIRLVTDQAQSRDYTHQTHRPAPQLPCWDSDEVRALYLPVGRSSLGSVAVAIDVASETADPVVAILYDPITKYDTTEHPDHRR